MSFEFGYRPEELRRFNLESEHALKERLTGLNFEFTGRAVMAEFFIIMDAYQLHTHEPANTQLFWTIWIMAFYALSLATMAYKKRQQVADILGCK